jgi:hypothetical protein
VVDFVQDVSCDPKPASSVFVANNSPSQHHYDCTIKELMTGRGFCVKHRRHCEVSDSNADFVIAGFQCSPFSSNRTNHSSTPWPPHVFAHAAYIGFQCQHICSLGSRRMLRHTVRSAGPTIASWLCPCFPRVANSTARFHNTQDELGLVAQLVSGCGVCAIVRLSYDIAPVGTMAGGTVTQTSRA